MGINELIANSAKGGYTPGTISGLADAYYKGQDEQAKNRVRDAFKDGIPLDENGAPDYGAMAKTLYQNGGLEQGNTLSNLGLARQQLQLGQEASRAIGSWDNGGQPPANVPTIPPSTATAIPGNAPRSAPINGPTNAPSGAAYRGGDARDGTSIVATISKTGIPDEMAGPLISQVSARLGLDPNAPISDPSLQARVQQTAQAFWQRSHGGQPQGAPQPGQPQPTPQGQPQPSPQVAQAQPQQAGFGPPPATDTRTAAPTGLDPEIQRRIAAFTQMAANPALPEPVRKAAQSRLDGLLKQIEPTPEMKNADVMRREGGPATLSGATSKLEGDKTYAGEEAKAYVKKYGEVIDTGSKAFQEVPQLEMALKITNDPNFYSGFGDKYNLALKRIVAGLGGDQDAARPQEAFNKIVSGAILAYLPSLRGLGQVRVAEMKLVQQASAASDNTPAGNRAILTVQQRVAQRASDIADIAQRYNGGRLDAGFDRKVSEYDKSHPLFTKEEMAEPKRLGLPQFSTQQEAAKAPRGTQFLSPDGKVRVVP